MQNRQLVIDRLKAMTVFDDPLAQSLTEQIGEIDDKMKEFTADLNSVSDFRTAPHPPSNKSSYCTVLRV